jgi:hypothetical protein
MNFDIYPYSITTCIASFVLIISGLIPHHLNNENYDDSVLWIWIIRVIVLLIITVTTFIIITRITNCILSKTSYANNITNELNKLESEKKSYRDSLSDLSKQAKQKDKTEYIEE